MEVVEDVKAIPGRVGNTIDETKKTTAEVVEEVLAVPGKVKKTAAEVKETAENTLKGFEHFFSKVEQLLSGKEPRRLKPTRPPPEAENTEDNIETIPKTSVGAPKSIAEIDTKLDTEVTEALRIAKETLDARKKTNS